MLKLSKNLCVNASNLSSYLYLNLNLSLNLDLHESCGLEERHTGIGHGGIILIGNSTVVAEDFALLSIDQP